jgi:hypothetical protein
MENFAQLLGKVDPSTLDDGYQFDGGLATNYNGCGFLKKKNGRPRLTSDEYFQYKTNNKDEYHRAHIAGFCAFFENKNGFVDELYQKVDNNVIDNAKRKVMSMHGEWVRSEADFKALCDKVTSLKWDSVEQEKFERCNNYTLQNYGITKGKLLGKKNFDDNWDIELKEDEINGQIMYAIFSDNPADSEIHFNACKSIDPTVVPKIVSKKIQG